MMNKDQSFEEYVKSQYREECMFSLDDPNCTSTMWNWWYGEMEGWSFTEEDYNQGMRLKKISA